jgi:hypothetical protein
MIFYGFINIFNQEKLISFPESIDYLLSYDISNRINYYEIKCIYEYAIIWSINGN